ncbi:interferon regulatory factor 7 [Genypterus blacodes]|uniref:interferon regulatory factor 7 n=1 Tax=Genypterus blacodes TaxID=154954 RepID=UPI003F767F2E
MQRPQFASWLIEQVETGQYTGLCYTSQNKFRVPWKHNSRKDCNDEDSRIFRAWAEASGKIHEFPNNKARWKTNFRCALNNLKVRFKMIKDNSKNDDDPHKIYEIINTENNCENLQTQYSQDDHDMRIDCSPVECLPSGNEHNLPDHFMALDLGNQPAEVQQWVPNYAQPCLAALDIYPAAPGPENHTHAIPQQPAYDEANPEPVPAAPQQLSIYDLEISIHYRKIEMLKTRMHTQRLQLHYQQEAPELNAHNLCFPATEGLLDHKQIDYTKRLLDSIQRGLLLEVRESGIYACRQDRCHVYASTSDPSVAHPEPRKLPQNTMVELLSFDKYVNELRQFRENNGGSPEYSINMCFGERFPDGKPLEKKLIVVKVVPLICRHFYEMAQLEGASSLHSASVSLQISHNSLFDLISSVFGPPAVEGSGQAVGIF